MADESRGWHWAFLTDLAIINPARSEAELLPATFHYVDLSSLSTGGIADIAELEIYAKNDAPSRAQRQLRECDSLVATVRPERGARGLVGAELDNQVGSTGLCVLRPIKKSDARFLYSIIRQDEFTEWCVANSTGTSYPAVSQHAIGRFPLFLPPARERALIGDVLGALDDKIESNRRIQNLLIQLARTMLDAGENEVRLGDIATCDKGLSYKGDGLQEDPSVGLPMVNLGNFGVDGWLNAEKLKYYSGEYKDRHLLKAGDLVVANTDLTQQRVIIGRPALIPPSLGKAIFTHHVTAIRPSKDEKLRLPIWAQLNSSAFRERAEGFATGTTVAGMPVEALLDFHIRIPDGGVISDAQELLDRVWVAESESRSLKHTREILMPELLSGRLRVKDAESMMENV